MLVAILLPAVVRAEDVLETVPVKRDAISIRLPRGWVVDDPLKHHTLLLVRTPQRDKDDASDFQAVLAISTDADAKLDGHAYQARIAKEFPSYNVVEEPARITIGNLSGTMFGGTFTQGPVKLRTRQYLFSLSNRLYIIAFTCLESRWNAYVVPLEMSVSTFAIGEKK